MTFREQVTNYLQAGFPCLLIKTTEERRAIGDIVAVSKAQGCALLTWSASEGTRQLFPAPRTFEDTELLEAACGTYTRDETGGDAWSIGGERYPTDKRSVYILRDPHSWPWDRDPILLRKLRDLLAGAAARGMTVILITPDWQPPTDIENFVTILNYGRPNAAELRTVAEGIRKSTGKDLEISDALIRALSGLTFDEAENALSLSFIECGRFDPAIVNREKCRAVARSGILQVIDPDPRGLEAVGGLGNLKTWINRRSRMFSREAEAYGIAPPKGILAVGVQGSGKSLVCKAIGSALGMPTLRFDIGAVFNSLVGESEARMRDTLALAEAMAPCILFVDEIEKGLAGSGGSGANDSGVTKRIFGIFLTWMQEKTAPVFVAATANAIEAIPPELFREGRFSQIFSVDLPSYQARCEITKIHLAKRNRDAAKFDIKAIAAASENHIGSEIEGTIEEAMVRAFDSGREVETSDLLEVAREKIPFSTTFRDQVDAIRAWAKNRAMPAETVARVETVELPNAGARKLNRGGN